MALSLDPDHVTALETRADSAAALRDESINLNTQGWYHAAVREVEAKLEE